jgi:hypothetical protein
MSSVQSIATKPDLTTLPVTPFAAGGAAHVVVLARLARGARS